MTSERLVDKLSKIKREELDRAKGNPSQSTALVRINKEALAVQTHMERYKRRAAGLSRNNNVNVEGFRRGRKAADDVNLKANAVTGSARPNQQLEN